MNFGNAGFNNRPMAWFIDKVRPKRRFFLRRVLPGVVGLVIGWTLGSYVPSSAGPAAEAPPPATQPAEAQVPNTASNGSATDNDDPSATAGSSE